LEAVVKTFSIAGLIAMIMAFAIAMLMEPLRCFPHSGFERSLAATSIFLRVVGVPHACS
jgi:hypothetical protein